MSREAVLLQWERKIEAAERREAPRRDAEAARRGRGPRTDRGAVRSARGTADAVASSAAAGAEPRPRRAGARARAERRTITITGQPDARRAGAARVRRRASWPSPTGSPSGPSCSGLFLVAVAAGTAHA